MQVGDRVDAGAIPLPAGVTLAGDPQQTVVTILAAPTAEQVEAELSGAEAEAGIEREQPAEAAEAAAAEPAG
jgi:large subunit ribosomal protein L25